MIAYNCIAYDCRTEKEKMADRNQELEEQARLREIDLDNSAIENEKLDTECTRRQLEIYRLEKERDNYKYWRKTACKYADKLRKALEIYKVYVKGISESGCCMTEGCTIDNPMCDANEAKAILRETTEAIKGGR